MTTLFGPLSALISVALAAAGAFSGYGLDRLLRHCAVEAGYPMARYVRSPRRWVLLAVGAIAFVVPAHLFSPAAAICAMIFLLALLGAACIDFDHMIIPDLFSVGLALLGLLLSALVPALHGYGTWNVWNCLRSAAAGGLGLALGSALVMWFGVVGEFFLRKEVLGFGDVKFVGAIGAFCGWQGAFFAVFAGSALGLVVMLLASWRRSHRGLNRPDDQGHYPFGPMLAVGAALYFLALRTPVDAFLNQYRVLF